MAKKITTGYCPTCGKTTKHQVIECTEKLGWRIFEGICSLGMIPLACTNDYECECLKCREINTLSW